MAESEYRFEGATDSREALRDVVDSMLVAARGAGEPVEVFSFLYRVRDGLRSVSADEPPFLLS